MRNFTLKKTMYPLIVASFLLMATSSYSQDIHFTFENAQNTNDGTNDFYEADIMIQTINATGSFN